MCKVLAPGDPVSKMYDKKYKNNKKRLFKTRTFAPGKKVNKLSKKEENGGKKLHTSKFILR